MLNLTKNWLVFRSKTLDFKHFEILIKHFEILGFSHLEFEILGISSKIPCISKKVSNLEFLVDFMYVLYHRLP